MSDIQKQIENINKQNEGMEIAFKNKGIAFTKLSIDSMDSETELTLLQNYNAYLKNISNILSLLAKIIFNFGFRL